MQVIFDGAGFKAEKLAASQFNGKLITDKKMQWKDIDAQVTAKNGSKQYISVKDQLWSSEKYGAIQIETKLTNTRTGESIKGCFYTCEASYYFWRIHTKEHGDTWAVISVSKMRSLVLNGGYKSWRTQERTEEKNRSYNRTYDRAEGVVIPLCDLRQHAQLIPVEVTIH